MLNLNELKELIKLVDESNLTEFKLKSNDYKISLKKESFSTSIVPQVKTLNENRDKPSQIIVAEHANIPSGDEHISIHNEEQDQQDLHKVVSPMVGTFYAAPSPEAAPYVQAGDRVSENTVVCIVEAMKLMNEIEAEVKGTIVEVLVDNGQLVEYGQPLFLVKVE